MIFTTLLNPSIDILYKVPQSGKSTYTGLQSISYPAGKGLNCAKVISKLGENVTLLSIMYNDDTVRFNKYVESYGIEHKYIEIDGTTRINTTIYNNEDCGTTHYNSTSSKLSYQVEVEYKDMLVQNIKDDDYISLMGSVPNGINHSIYNEIINLVKKKNVTTFVDTSGIALHKSIEAKPVIVSPNEYELEMLFEEPIEGIQHLALKGKRLIDKGIEKVFITLGEDGVIAINNKECIICRPPSIEVKDTVGCGDAFLAGVIVGEKRGFSFSELCRMAVACGTSNANNFGPGEINKDQVWKLMEDVSIVSL